jgi:hypothetical protein
LSPVEKASLHAYLHWRLNTPVNMTGLKARLANVSLAQKQVVSHMLVSIALADGTVDPSEVKQLEKLYTTLGLDKTMVSSDIHRVSTARVQHSTPASVQQMPMAATEFDLDEDLLAIHESDTVAVQSMLGAIFADEDVEEAGTAVEEPQSIDLYPGLQRDHQSLFETLLDKDQWSLSEVQQMCKSAGLMVDGAIEIINDWAYEQVEAAVLDDDGDILIDREIADELTQLVCR